METYINAFWYIHLFPKSRLLKAAELQIANADSCHRASNACWGVLAVRATCTYLQCMHAGEIYERETIRIDLSIVDMTIYPHIYGLPSMFELAID